MRGSAVSANLWRRRASLRLRRPPASQTVRIGLLRCVAATIRVKNSTTWTADTGEMNKSPLRVLVVGYALAAVAASIATGAGLISVGAALLFTWIGGALAVLAVAAFGTALATHDGASPDALLESDLQRWGEDLHMDNPQAGFRRKA